MHYKQFIVPKNIEIWNKVTQVTVKQLRPLQELQCSVLSVIHTHHHLDVSATDRAAGVLWVANIIAIDYEFSQTTCLTTVVGLTHCQAVTSAQPYAHSALVLTWLALFVAEHTETMHC